MGNMLGPCLERSPRRVLNCNRDDKIAIGTTRISVHLRAAWGLAGRGIAIA
jgi:hypothetical protein